MAESNASATITKSTNLDKLKRKSETESPVEATDLKRKIFDTYETNEVHRIYNVDFIEKSLQLQEGLSISFDSIIKFHSLHRHNLILYAAGFKASKNYIVGFDLVHQKELFSHESKGIVADIVKPGADSPNLFLYNSHSGPGTVDCLDTVTGNLTAVAIPQGYMPSNAPRKANRKYLRYWNGFVFVERCQKDTVAINAETLEVQIIEGVEAKSIFVDKTVCYAIARSTEDSGQVVFGQFVQQNGTAKFSTVKALDSQPNGSENFFLSGDSRTMVLLKCELTPVALACSLLDRSFYQCDLLYFPLESTFGKSVSRLLFAKEAPKYTIYLIVHDLDFISVLCKSQDNRLCLPVRLKEAGRWTISVEMMEQKSGHAVFAVNSHNRSVNLTKIII